MISRTALILASLATVSFAGVRSGKAEVEVDWLCATKSYEAGKPVQTAVRLVVDQGWHTYWLNPGDGGMKISAVWALPAGWTAGELEHPVPQRFTTGELAGFGYQGAVVFPVKFTPPAGFTGPASLKGKISWLTCNDSACVPGTANLELDLEAGTAAATAEAGLIEAALKLVPRPNPRIAFFVEETPKTLVLTLQGARKMDQFDLSGYEAFPATPNVIASAAKIDFKRSSEVMKAEVPKSEYAESPLKELTLVLAKPGLAPILIEWRSE